MKNTHFSQALNYIISRKVARLSCIHLNLCTLKSNSFGVIKHFANGVLPNFSQK